MQDIKEYIDNSLNFQSFDLKKIENLDKTKNYYENARADAIHC